MFKPGDKVKRKHDSIDDWWKFTCKKFNQATDGVFTVNTIWGNDCIQLDEFLQDPEYEFDPDCFELAEQPEGTKMISLKENKNALLNLGATIGAIEQFDALITHYSEDKPGPAYIQFNHGANTLSGSANVQINREIILVALKAQRQKLVDYMATLGIDANN